MLTSTHSAGLDHLTGSQPCDTGIRHGRLRYRDTSSLYPNCRQRPNTDTDELTLPNSGGCPCMASATFTGLAPIAHNVQPGERPPNGRTKLESLEDPSFEHLPIDEACATKVFASRGRTTPDYR